ncbi:short-chain dehydrogenase/reductase [Labrys miyagiensis]|uniref:Short-chain dehydrogenase/reductase n=1 Tax=Labrys miyagiensis TaxID=346912 RepID=A0ABQ6CTQ3_9HYPH|nr:SDR family oxidoreductase [Labrys miyagiensis]GLS22360.1 short-chain dehydrogenase/reductase [Labrys miyagiensis]
MKKIIVVTGSSSGFGRMISYALARAGHTVFASMRESLGRNAPQVADMKAFARDNKVDLRPLELDVSSEASVEAAIAKVIADTGRLDVVIHNAGHMVYGPAESFTPAQLAALYDVNVLSTQRVNRATLPHLRQQREGLVIWISSSSTRGGTPPYLAPYFAAKAGMDAMAISYAGELARWGVETSIIVPGSFTTGTKHFAHAGKPGDPARADEYAKGPTADIAEVALKNLAAIAPADADPEEVAREVVRVVDLPSGKRPFRVHIDPVDDGAEVVNRLADRIRAEFLRRIDLADLLTPHGG